MRRFLDALKIRNPKPEQRRWVYVAYDQLHEGLGLLKTHEPAELGIVMLESPWKAARRPYHKQKLATVLTNARHFALEQAERGVAVRYVVSDGSYGDALAKLTVELGPIKMMEPAEHELRADIAELVRRGNIDLVPHDGWLTSHEQFRELCGTPPWRMDVFYRGVREASGVLMEKGKPVGGRFSFDGENRERWRGDPPAPKLPTFAVDDITVEVCELIETAFAAHPGELHPELLPATKQDAQALWTHALSKCLADFGPYEDAMAHGETTLFHTRVSALLNLHRLLALDLITDVERAELPLPSKEGFIRQVLGWREYMRHVHLATDGFRAVPGQPTPVLPDPGDGGYERWSGRAWPQKRTQSIDGGAAPSLLGTSNAVPPAFWGTPSGLACLDSVVADVWREGYSHHITRLMILCNIAQLLDVSPRELTDWFWVAYVDAYDWVVEPNVLAMGMFAMGELATTKPYVSGAPYINRMSDYCGTCAFDPKRNCPLTRMYWAYLARHADKLARNPRMMRQVMAMRGRSEPDKERDALVFHDVQAKLAAGRTVEPA